MGRDVVSDLLDSIRQPRKRDDDPGGLTGREQEILDRLARGASNKEIASQLKLGEQTVKNHLQKIFAKLHVDNRVELALMAIEQGLVTIADPPRRAHESRPETSKA